MKETVTANIGSMPFTLDTDAYEALRVYFTEIRKRLPKEELETASDIETRMGEILREKVPTPMYVVSIGMVRAAIERLGTPDCFGTPQNGCEKGPDGQGAQPSAGNRTNRAADGDSNPRLRRSRTNRSLAGVCGGVAEYFECDPTLVRLITLLLLIFGGISIWVYIILWIVIPEENRADRFQREIHS